MAIMETWGTHKMTSATKCLDINESEGWRYMQLVTDVMYEAPKTSISMEEWMAQRILVDNLRRRYWLRSSYWAHASAAASLYVS
jgi:hypothetical protein